MCIRDRPQAAQELLVKWSGQNGYDISQFFPDEEVNAEINAVYGGNMQEGTPPPPLDGRQAPVLNALHNSQLPTS